MDGLQPPQHPGLAGSQVQEEEDNDDNDDNVIDNDNDNGQVRHPEADGRGGQLGDPVRQRDVEPLEQH